MFSQAVLEFNAEEVMFFMQKIQCWLQLYARKMANCFTHALS